MCAMQCKSSVTLRRFLPENKDKVNPYAFMPFGQGPRGCVGQRLAYLEAKIGIAHVVHKFNFSLAETMQMPLKYEKGAGMLKAVGGLQLVASPR